MLNNTKADARNAAVKKKVMYEPILSFNMPTSIVIPMYIIEFHVIIVPIARDEHSLNIELIITTKVGKVTEMKNPDKDISISPFSLSNKPDATHMAAIPKKIFNPLIVPILCKINPPKNLPKEKAMKNSDEYLEVSNGEKLYVELM